MQSSFVTVGPNEPFVIILRTVGVADPRWRFTADEHSASTFVATAQSSGRIQIEIPKDAQLEIRWNDLNTGEARSRSFLIDE
jgi:hypothetical protein